MIFTELYNGAAEYLLQCQSYEGGFGGEPGSEAHGGYNFCTLASLLILKQVFNLNCLDLRTNGIIILLIF